MPWSVILFLAEMRWKITQVQDLDVGPIETGQIGDVVVGKVLFGYGYRE